MIIAVRGVATCTPVRTCVLGKECEFITSVNVDFYKEPGMRLVTKREVKIRRLNTSINLHSDTALFTALFCIY